VLLAGLSASMNGRLPEQEPEFLGKDLFFVVCGLNIGIRRHNRGRDNHTDKGKSDQKVMHGASPRAAYNHPLLAAAHPAPRSRIGLLPNTKPIFQTRLDR
jgi:hypothetical protein